MKSLILNNIQMVDMAILAMSRPMLTRYVVPMILKVALPGITIAI